MGTRWTNTVQERSKTALRAIQDQEQDTAYGLLQGLRQAGWEVTGEGDTLRVKHGTPEMSLSERQRAGIRKHKRLMLCLLAPRPGLPEPPCTWADEWAFERDILLRRAGCCWKEADRAALLALADAGPKDDAEFTDLWRRVRDLEGELHARGDLPPTEVF